MLNTRNGIVMRSVAYIVAAVELVGKECVELLPHLANMFLKI